MGLFKQQASNKQLAILSRSLGTSLFSGIDVLRALELAGNKNSGSMHQIIQQVIADLKSGNDITTSIENRGGYFPDLFVDMVNVGEKTGSMPEVLKSLGNHYENTVRLKKEFLSQITMPMVQLVLAIFIIAGLICLLGWIGESTGETFDILGFGLLGTGGALLWLGGWLMGVVGAYVAYQLITTSLSGKKFIHRFLMSIPVVGSCMRSFAIARFSWAFHLTQQAGMPIDESLDASFRSTSNGAFIAATPDVISQINEGETLSDALASTKLFTREFEETVIVAEEAGTVPEALDRLSPQFEDDARRSMKALAGALGWFIWASVAAFIIFIIFRVFLWYVSLLNNVINEIN